MLPHEASAMLKERPFSISQLRTFDRCPKAYELQYLTEPRVPVLTMGASVWFGGVIQRIIQRAYHGVGLPQGHIQVWQRVCGPLFETLRDWFALDGEYRASGAANSNARKAWLQAHPAYKELTAQIDGYQQEYLTDWTWSENYSLAGYYRWSATLAKKTSLSQVVLPHAILVEGLPVYWPDGELIRRFDGEVSAGEHYRLLHGVIGGAHVVGVPDEFGIDPDGVAWIADNKVTTSQLSPDELSYDSQLAAYYLLLVQNGWIAEGQPTRVGHCYITEKAPPRYEWADISRYEGEVLPQLHAQFAQLKAAITGGPLLRKRGLQPAAFSPCKFCGVRHACFEQRNALHGENGR